MAHNLPSTTEAQPGQDGSPGMDEPRKRISWYDRQGLRVVEGAPFVDTRHGPPAASACDFRHAVVRLPIKVLA